MLPGIVTGLDHIAIAVSSLEGGIQHYRDQLGLQLTVIEDVLVQQVKTAVLTVGSLRVELLEPLSADSPVGKFLAKRGPGLHHIAFKVDDIHRAIAHCRQLGLRMIDEKPRAGAGGALIAFIHPSATGGVLIELTARPTAY